MPITANFTITQGTDNSKFTVTDTTNYSGGELVGAMTNRQVAFYKSDGTLLGTYVFNGSDLTLEVEDLTKDLALKGMMTLTPGTPVGGSVYTKTNYVAVTGYNMTAFYQRHSKMANNPRLEVNRDYTLDTYRIDMELTAAAAAIAAEDIVSAQFSLDRAKKIVDTNRIPY